MAYECQNFCDGQKLKAEHLNKIEQAIVDIEGRINDGLPDANPVKIAQAEDGTITITMPMSDGTTDTCVLNPGEDGWPASVTVNGVTKPLEWEGF